MALELKQQVKLTQQLVMTPQLQQAIKLLQLSRMELVGLVQNELEENPVLEEVAEGDEERVGDDANAETPADSLDASPEAEVEVANDVEPGAELEAGPSESLGESLEEGG